MYFSRVVKNENMLGREEKEKNLRKCLKSGQIVKKGKGLNVSVHEELVQLPRKSGADNNNILPEGGKGSKTEQDLAY